MLQIHNYDGVSALQRKNAKVMHLLIGHTLTNLNFGIMGPVVQSDFKMTWAVFPNNTASLSRL